MFCKLFGCPKIYKIKNRCLLPIILIFLAKELVNKKESAGLKHIFDLAIGTSSVEPVMINFTRTVVP